MDAPRPAATVVLAREGARGPEVLVLRRGAGHRFLPGFVVFPGGAVEPDDAALAGRWFGEPAEAARACALRELAEEVGLALTGRGAVGTDDPLGAVDADPPTAGRLVEISHWVAPPDVPVRFDARFFAALAPRTLEPRADGGETEHAWWARPSDLLAGGDGDLYLPTRCVLEALATCDDAAAILAARIEQVE
ncbi:MAG: NUDIX hydrolase [Actinomycetota bacterium]